MLTDKHKEILQQIIDLSGACLHPARCKLCPFANVCLPGFLSPLSVPSQPQRLKMALDVLTHYELLGSEEDMPSLKEGFNRGTHQ